METVPAFKTVIYMSNEFYESAICQQGVCFLLTRSERKSAALSDMYYSHIPWIQ